jgi:excinuclease ABC subunit C
VTGAPTDEAPGDPRARDPWALPDLIVIDGGKGQLGSVLAAARDAGVDVGPGGLPIVGLAKERDFAAPDARGSERRPDRVFLPNAKDPIAIRPNSAEMYVLAQLRDEAHRFAVTFHRSQRKRRTLRSALGDVAGIGPTRQRALLRHFGSLRKIRDASVDDLTAVEGMTRKAALALLAHFAIVPADASAPAAPDATAPPAPTDEGGDEGAEEAIESAFAEVDAEADAPGDP